MPDLLAAYGLDDRVAALSESFLADRRDAAARSSRAVAAAVTLGRVARVDRGSCLVVTAAGITRVVTSRVPQAGGPVATGDWIVVEASPPGGAVIAAVLPRRSAVSRRAPETGEEQVLAANVDVLAVVSALDRPISASRIERTLVLAWESGARPVVLLTKADLASDLESALALAGSAARGAPLIVTSAGAPAPDAAVPAGAPSPDTPAGVPDPAGPAAAGLEAVRALAGPGMTLAFLGPSGAGKSTLVNLLAGEERHRTGSVRGLDQRGRHTTTARELVLVPGGGVLLDTPGLRSIGLLEAPTGVGAVFGEVEELATRCRFVDCAHRSEPGCAVRSAIDEGQLDPRRLASYEKLLRELAHEERKEPGRAGRAARLELQDRYRKLRREGGEPRMDARRDRRH